MVLLSCDDEDVEEAVESYRRIRVLADSRVAAVESKSAAPPCGGGGDSMVEEWLNDGACKWELFCFDLSCLFSWFWLKMGVGRRWKMGMDV